MKWLLVDFMELDGMSLDDCLENDISKDLLRLIEARCESVGFTSIQTQHIP